MKIRLKSGLLLLLFILPLMNRLDAQAPASETADSTAKEMQDSTQKKKPKKDRKVRVLPLPTFGYAPETRGYVGAVALFTLRLYDDPGTRTSNASVEFNYTMNKQLIAWTEWNLIFKDEKYIWIGDNSIRRYPEYFFGLGNGTRNVLRELFDSRRLDIGQILLRQVRPHLFAGLQYRLQSMWGIEPIEGGILADGAVPGGAGGLSSGAGYIARWDTRDNLLNPSAGGSYISFANTFFGKALGSDFKFSSFELDARYYLKVFKNQILAFQTYNLLNAGIPPFRLMGLMGSESHQRGYLQGRFRDRHYFSAQAELRWTVYKRWGVAAFAGVGDVAEQIGDLRLWDLKHSLGGGIRFKIDRKENVNLRLDYAVGRQSTGFYISFGEAF